MEFCPECGAMLLPKDGILKCNSCGHEKNLSDNNEYEVSEDIKESDNVKMLGEDVDVGPITNETCPECGHDKLHTNYYKPVVLMKHLHVFLLVPNVNIPGEHTTEVFL